MKKVKVLLSAIAVFAVVGGALAFKANSTQSVFVHDPADPRTDACTLQSFGKTLTINAGTPIQTVASIASKTSNCPLVPVYPGL